jgi:hypothetical protein
VLKINGLKRHFRNASNFRFGNWDAMGERIGQMETDFFGDVSFLVYTFLKRSRRLSFGKLEIFRNLFKKTAFYSERSEFLRISFGKLEIFRNLSGETFFKV